MDVRINRVIGLGQIPGVKKRLAHMLGVVVPDRVGEYRDEVVHTEPGRFHQDGIVQRWVHKPRMDQAPTVPEPVGIVTFDVKTFARLVLQNGNSIVAALDQQIHRQIYRSARNSFLESTLERYFNLSLRLWFLVIDHEVRLREAVDEHVALIEAVLAQDADLAESIMRRHVMGFEREIRKVLVG